MEVLPFLRAGLFAAQHAPQRVFCKPDLTIPTWQILNPYPLSICSTYTACFIAVFEHPSPVLGDILLSSRSDFHISSGALWGKAGEVLPARVTKGQICSPAQGWPPRRHPEQKFVNLCLNLTFLGVSGWLQKQWRYCAQPRFLAGRACLLFSACLLQLLQGI